MKRSFAALIANWCARLLTAGIGLYAVALLALWLGQERLLFQPVRLDPATALSSDPDVRESFVEVPGARLSMLELRLPNPKGVVLYLHGNGGNLQSWFVDADYYRKANFDLVMPDYRGYGKSTGRIDSEAQLHADVQAVWRQIAARYAGRRVVVCGRSLGTGLAAHLASQIRPDLTMLVSPYTSMLDLARLHYPWVPAGLIRYPLRTDLAISGLRTPLLLLHGEHDTLIPTAHSRALQKLAPQSQLMIIAGAGHNDLQAFDSYRQAMTDALRAL